MAPFEKCRFVSVSSIWFDKRGEEDLDVVVLGFCWAIRLERNTRISKAMEGSVSEVRDKMKFQVQL